MFLIFYIAIYVAICGVLFGIVLEDMIQTFRSTRKIMPSVNPLSFSFLREYFQTLAPSTQILLFLFLLTFFILWVQSFHNSHLSISDVKW